MMKFIVNIAAFVDRKYNRLFHRDKCIKIVLDITYFEYNDIIVMEGSGHALRYLGKDYYKLIKK